MQSNNDEQYPLFMNATCFLCKFRDNYFIITAKHCIEKNAFNVAELFILINNEELVCFGLKDSFNFKYELKTEEANFVDLTIIGIDKNQHSIDELNRLDFIDIENNTIKNKVIDTSPINASIHGFPTENSNHRIDYENKKITIQKFINFGFLNVKAAKTTGTVFVKMNDELPRNLSDYSGISGAPMFFQDNSKGWKFAGVVIGYNYYSHEFQIVEGLLIKQLIEGIVANKITRQTN